MCGIAGIFDPDNSRNYTETIAAMTAAISHRGPDASGSASDGPCHLGHRRLSIIDLSPEGNQPLISHDKRFSLIFNGEIYNYLDVRKKFGDYPFRSHTDSEVIIAAWSKLGPACLDEFHGMFAFAIWDRQEEKLTLVRDRMGIKPLYYAEQDKRLLYASEIRSLLASGMIDKKIDEAALANYLAYGTVHAPASLIRGVKMLMPGHLLEITKNGIREKCWWNGLKQDQINISAADAKAGVKERLSRAVEIRKVSDVPLGAFLSGGIDSSAVVALLAASSDAAIDTFSVVFREKEYDESAYSSLIAKKYHTRHHPLMISPEKCRDYLPDILDEMDHPTIDGVNSWIISKLTKEAGVTVALSGLGGDELFGGYPVFRQLPEFLSSKSLRLLPKPLRKLLGSFMQNSKQLRRQKAAELLKSDPTFEAVYPLFRRIWFDHEIEKHVYSGFSHENPILKLASHSKKTASGRIFTATSIAEICGYTQNVLLRDTDQMSMAHALEVRVPFFDHQLVEFVLSLPDELKKGTYPKQLLVESLDGLVPDEVVFRKKMGFSFPWDVWLRNELKDFAGSAITFLGKEGILPEAMLSREWNLFLESDQVSWVRIWSLAVLGKWMMKNGISR